MKKKYGNVWGGAFLFLIAFGLVVPARAQFLASSYFTATSATFTYVQLAPASAPVPSAPGQLYYDSTNNVLWLSTATNYASWIVVAPRGVYLGITPATYTGNLGGLNGAAALCSLTWPGSRMCTISETMTLPGPLPATNGWAGSGSTGGSTCNNNATQPPYTNASASYDGSNPNRANGNTNIGATTCSTPTAINCCR